MYIVSLTYKASLEAIDKELNNHIDYLKKQYAAGNFLASGRKIPRNGGVILAKAQSREELDEILKQDGGMRVAQIGYSLTRSNSHVNKRRFF